MTKILKLFLLFSLLILASSCYNKKTDTTKKMIPITVKLDSLDRELLEIVNKIKIPGFSVAIVYSDSVLFTKGYGKADIANNVSFTPNTKHAVASISKTFIGVAIMKLVEQGKLNLDEPINNLLPFEITSPHHPDIPITVRHLVTHTSTINDDFDDGDKAPSWFIEPYPYDIHSLPEDFQEDLYYYDGTEMSLETYIKEVCASDGNWYAKTNFIEFKPGVRYEYSNMGASIAGHIVEIVSKMSFPEFTQTYIFNPLEMKNTSWFYDDLPNTSKLYIEKTKDNEQVFYEFPRFHEAGYPDGQLKTTANDMSLYLTEMVKGFRGQGTILDKDSYTLMLNPQLERHHYEPVEELSTYPFDDEFNVGVFWSISPTRFRIHNGGMNGAYASLYFNPENDMGIFVMANLADGSFGKILDTLLEYETALGDLVQPNS